MKRPKPEALQVQAQDWKHFAQEFQDESDRAAAVLGATWLDVRLQTLIGAFLVDDPKEVDALLGPQRPLEPFGVRVRVAYGLGLISTNVFEDLVKIKDIRNGFAHQLHGLTFEQAEIRDRCAALHSIKGVESVAGPSSGRKRYEIAVSILANYLSAQVAVATKQRRQRPR